MTDTLTVEQRRRNMSRIRGKDTRPEKIVRSLVHQLGYRFRLYRKELPGNPDLVFPSRKKVIFVHGCFWHLHDCKYGLVTPSTNAEFWREKRAGNRHRDNRNQTALVDLGWSFLIIWECQLRNLEIVKKAVREFLH